MAFFGKLKNILGLSEDSYEQEVNNDDNVRDARVTPLNKRTDHSAKPEVHTPPTAAPDMPADPVSLPEYPDAVPEAIFKKVVEIFDESLPEFLRKTVDRDAQCRYIHDALDSSMKEYIANLDSIAKQRFEAQWGGDRDRIKRDMSLMQEKTRQAEESMTEQRELRLSAERQKRALSERVHDLEKQIATLEAEREQFDLENKSLVNKIRVLTTQEGDLDALRNDNEALRAEVQRLKAQTVVADQPAEVRSQEIADLEEKLAQAEVNYSRLMEERDSLNVDVETLKKRCEIADSMINDLNKNLGAAREDLSKAAEVVPQDDGKLAELQSRIESLEAEAHDRISLIESQNEEIEQLKHENTESHSALTLFEEALTKIETDHAAEIARRDEEIKAQLAEIESLKSTIENNLRQQAASEASLRQEIENLRKTTETSAPDGRRNNHGPVPPPIPFDDSLEDTNWLTSDSSANRDDFGYREPKRRPQNDDPAQMSLW